MSTSGTLTSDTSTAFDITPGAAKKLSFFQQPSSTYSADDTITVKVEVQDNFGNRVTGSSAPIDLALLNANGATLGGTTTVNEIGRAHACTPVTSRKRMTSS